MEERESRKNEKKKKRTISCIYGCVLGKYFVLQSSLLPMMIPVPLSSVRHRKMLL